MRLRTFESFWLVSNGILYSYPSLQNKHVSCSLLVVGGGITGALVSHELMEKGYDVILIDKRDIASGSTAATTSMLQYEIDVPLYQLAEMIGEEEAASCYKAGIKAIQKLGNLVNTHKIDCGFEKKQSLYIAREKKDVAGLKKEYEIRNKYDLGVSWIEPKDMLKEYGIKCFGAILSEVAASVDAYKLAHDLIAFNVSRGMKVYDQTAIKTFNTSDARPHAVTENGSTIQFKTVIFCTGYESVNLLKEKIADLFYTYATVSERSIGLRERLKKTLVWDTGSPYLYLRSTDDGRLLAGGEDSPVHHSLFQNKIKERKAKKIKRRLAKLLPGVDFIEDFSWGGIFGATKDGLPYIGKSPEYANAFFVLGFGGNGITFSVQAMEIITDLLSGYDNKLSQFYRFGR